MSASPISRLICQHDFFWSRRRQADVCRRCGAISPVLSLHFRSKAAWTVGADLPPERAETLRPVEIAPEPALLTSSAALEAGPEPTPEPPAVSDAAAPVMDFSGRGASLTTPLVTFGLSGNRQNPSRP